MMLAGICIIALVIIVMVAVIRTASKYVRLSRLASIDSLSDIKSFGYKQELLRDMGGFSNFAVSFSIISILTGAVTLFGYGFNQGGPAIMGVGWPLVTLMVLFVAASMAELTSAIPTSGAIYHWASILGGKRLGWLTAWLNVIGQVTIVAGIDFGCAGFTAALLFGDATRVEILSVYALILISHALLNHVGIKIVGRFNSISAIYHLMGVMLIIAALVFFGPKHNVGYLFKMTSTVTSGATPYWFAFLVGLLQAQWTLTGYDASAHTSEETVDARVRAPWGVFLSVAISGIFGFLMLSLVTMSITDASAVAAAGDNAFIVAIEQAAGGTVGQVILWICTFAMWFCGLASVTSASRMVYAFSRDKGLPLSHIWAKISRKFKTPAEAIWLITAVAFVAALSDGVYAVITSLSVIGLYTSYFIPIALRFRAKLRGVWTAEDDGPWSLGRGSMFINAIACIWIIALVILMVISPSDVVVFKGFTLHYATGEVFGTALVILCVYYFASARKHFTGPKLGSYATVHDRLND